MRDLLDGTRLYDTRFQQGLIWATVFKSSAGAFTLPDDPQSTYVFSPSGAGEVITLPRLIGNTGFGGSAGITAANVNQLNGLWLEIVNKTTVTGTLQAALAAGDGGTNVGAVVGVAASATQYTTGQYQVIQGTWIRII